MLFKVKIFKYKNIYINNLMYKWNITTYIFLNYYK